MLGFLDEFARVCEDCYGVVKEFARFWELSKESLGLLGFGVLMRY